MKVMIISPHMDDEVLGCSTWLREEEVLVVYTTRTHPNYPEVSEENDWLKDFIGFSRKWLSFDKINHLDSIPQATLIREYEEIIEMFRPHTVLVPSPSYNQDHRAVFNSVLTACRPHDRNWFCKRILSYEQPETWGTMRSDNFFKANYFRELDLEFKLECYQIYESQIRGHRSFEHITALALFRGMQCMKKYAEAFEVLRWLD